MVRRGWTALDAPSGWIQVLRGPRPKSVQWPSAKEGNSSDAVQPQGRWRQVPPPRQQNVDQEGKSFRRLVPRMNPDSNREAARVKIGKLEKALEAMWDSEGPVVDYLKTELEKARTAAKRRPVNVEVEECRKFIIRSEKRISELDAERAAEVGALDEARARLSRLEAEQAAVPKVVSEPVPEVVPPPEWAAEVQRSREELERLRAGRSPVPVDHSVQSSAEAANLLQERAAKRRAGVAGPVPNNPQDVEGWLSEKHTELRDAIEFGDKESILALTDLIRQGDLQCHKLPSTEGNMVARRS